MLVNRVFFLLLALLLPMSAHSAPSPLPKDPALDKPVTLAVKGESVSDVVSSLAKQTGADLRLTKDTADQKLTVFVDAKPARDVMLGIETLLEYKWSLKKDSTRRTYELWVPETVKQERQSYLDRATADAFDRIDSEMKQAAARARGRSSREILSSLRESLQAKDSDGIQSAYLDLFAPVYMSLPQSARDAMRTECKAYVSSPSPEPAWQLPAGAANTVLDALSAHDEVVGARSSDGSAIRFDAVSLSFEPRITTDSVTLTCMWHAISDDIARRASFNQRDEGTDLARVALKEIRPQSGVELPRRDDASLDRMVSVEFQELAGEAGTVGMRVERAHHGMPPLSLGPTAFANRADVLALLHKRLGVQVIADYYSFWHAMPSVKDWTVRDLLDSFGLYPGVHDTVTKSLDAKSRTAWNLYFASGSDGYRAKWGWDGQFLYMRAADIPGCDACETPNRILDPLRRSYAQKKWLNIDEMATLAMLSDDRLSLICQRPHLMKLADDPEEFPFGYGHFLNLSQMDMVVALRIYGAMSPDQRKQAFGRGVSLADLGSDGIRAARAFDGNARTQAWSQVAITYSASGEPTVIHVPASGEAGTTITYQPDGQAVVSVPSDRLDRRRPAVGIYDKYGWRVDKPGSLFSSMGEDPIDTALITVREGCAPSRWEQAAGFARTDVPGYTMTLHLEKGTREIPIPLKHRKPTRTPATFAPSQDGHAVMQMKPTIDEGKQ